MFCLAVQGKKCHRIVANTHRGKVQRCVAVDGYRRAYEVICHMICQVQAVIGKADKQK